VPDGYTQYPQPYTMQDEARAGVAKTPAQATTAPIDRSYNLVSIALIAALIVSFILVLYLTLP